MAPSSETIAVQGYRVGIREGRLHVSPPGASKEVLAEVRARAPELLEALLHVPEHLAETPLEEMKALAFRMISYIDGPDGYEQRVRFMPEYLRLAERITLRMEATP